MSEHEISSHSYYVIYPGGLDGYVEVGPDRDGDGSIAVTDRGGKEIRLAVEEVDAVVKAIQAAAKDVTDPGHE